MYGLQKTRRCAELSIENVDKEVTIMGWVQKQRNHGRIIFVDVCDHSGLLQVIFEENDCGNEVFAKAEKLRSKFVVEIIGIVSKREGGINKNLKTGEIELRATDMHILSKVDIPPIAEWILK